MAPKMRGTIEHVSSGKRISFIDLEKAMQFIREISSQPPQPLGKKS